MPKVSESISELPTSTLVHLAQLGTNLATARLRRRESQRVWSKRMGISVPTLIRMEQGDPRVAMGVYATAIWLMGRSDQLPQLADPKHDLGALEREIRQVTRRRS